MPHFTYQKTSIDVDLMQGDILARTPELQKVIECYHPYYANAKFTHYMVSSQTCDLVRRKGLAKTEYITLCAVKPFSKVFEREAQKHQSPIMYAANAIAAKHKNSMLLFIERLLNNNHPEYFYLHEDAAGGFSERSCAYLRLAITIKACHYKQCVEARILSLTENFQAKLGWLIGNLYARVGTEDWVPKLKSDSEWRALLNDVLQENIVVIDDKKAEAASKSLDLTAFDGLPAEEIQKAINSLLVTKKKDEIISAVIDELKSDPAVGDVEKLRRRLANSQALASLVRG